MTQIHYTLGSRAKFQNITAPCAWKDTKSIEGVKIWARDERTGEYVRVYETGPNDTDGWIQGNYEGS